MVFDLQATTSYGDMTNGYSFVEELLATALSFNLTSLESDPESFVEFLDATSQLRLLPLEEIDSSNRQAFCLFVNVYHTLLQHAMLLSINGPLHKRSVGHFMRTSCYEIGGDVFSLAELHCCVIRGKLSRPVGVKPPYIEPPKKSNAYRFYALDYTDPRINFVIVSIFRRGEESTVTLRLDKCSCSPSCSCCINRIPATWLAPQRSPSCEQMMSILNSTAHQQYFSNKVST
jgi:hypothetical protein